MLPAPLWLVLVRGMLVVDDGTRITRFSLHGEGNETRMPLFSHRQSEYMHMWKNNIDGQSLPRVGKVASGASRIGY